MTGRDKKGGNSLLLLSREGRYLKRKILFEKENERGERADDGKSQKF